MNGAGSPGQHVWMGSRVMSTSSPVSTISWQTPLETTFGRESAIDLSFFRPCTFSRRPCGGCISSTSASFAATASRLGAPKAMAMRRSVPNWLISSGCSEPFGFSKSSAGPPPALTSRSTISVISRYGSTSALMRTQLTLAFEQRDPVAEVFHRRHGGISLWTRARTRPPRRASIAARRARAACSFVPSSSIIIEQQSARSKEASSDAERRAYLLGQMRRRAH